MLPSENELGKGGEFLSSASDLSKETFNSFLCNFGSFLFLRQSLLWLKPGSSVLTGTQELVLRDRAVAELCGFNTDSLSPDMADKKQNFYPICFNAYIYLCSCGVNLEKDIRCAITELTNNLTAARSAGT